MSHFTDPNLESEYAALAAEGRRERRRAFFKGALWAVPNVVLVAMLPLALLFDRFLPAGAEPPAAIAMVLVFAPWVAALATPIVAAIVDGRTHTAKWLVGTAWGGLLVNVLFMAQTPEWKHGDGLPQFFTCWFTLIGGAGYVALVVVAFAMKRRHGRHAEG